uniref:Uncharacterized protein n=1 Tax=Fagus sylvatica TaxID=28930 RepID=A0A2N9GG57_FAGSY
MEPSAERLVEFPMVVFAFTIKWLERTSGPGPSEQEIRMVALERKFDELLSFVQLIAKRNTDDENQRKEDDKDTSEAEPEGHSNTNATPPRPPTPPKPEGKDSQLDSKIDSLEEKIRLIQGLNSFGNTDFSSMSWFPNMTVPPKFKAPEFEKYNGRGDPMIHLQMYCRKMAPYADNEPLLIQTFQDTLTGNAAEWYSQLKKISHWKELADTFLGSIRVQLPNSSGPIRSAEDGEEEIEDALKTKKIVDMTALMALAEQAAKKAPTKKEGRGCANDREKQWEDRGKSSQPFTMQSGTTKAYSNPGSDSGSSPGPSTPDAGKAELYPILIEKNLISPTIPRPYNGAPRKDFNQNLTCDFHFGEVGHAIGNCNHLRHRVQDLIDHGILKFEGLPNITTNPLPNHPEGGVNMVEIEEGNEERILWRRLFYTLEKKRHITPLEAPPGPSTGDACEYHSGARGHSLECCEEFKKKITNLMENGLEDEMDLDNLQDEGADWGYFMEDDTDEWRDVDFTKFFQFPCLIVPPGFETPEFEIFYENGDPEVHLQKYGEKMALHLENELLMISVFPESLSKQAAAWKDEEPYIIPDPGVDEVIVEIKEESSMLSLPALTEGEEEEKVKPLPPAKDQTTLPLPKKEKSQSRHHHQAISPPPLLKKNMLALCVSQVAMSKRYPSYGANEGEEPREVKIGTRCAAEQKEALIALLREFHEIFAWSYQDMPGLDTDIVVHKIPLKPECKPVKQALRRMKPEVILKIKEGGGKAIEGRMCVDYRDLNRASPKDNFPLPHIDTLVDNTATNVVFSFMDGFSGYNQIKMAEEDKSKTAFITHWGTFVYDVMPFGLKNAGATYQRAMVTLFHDMIHHEIEVYVDDMIAKSRTAQDHLTDLRKLFQRLKKYQLRLNPNKCAFGVTSGKLLGFIVSGRGIEIDPAKLTGEPASLCSSLLRKDVKIKWTEDCQRAFDKIKEYLLNPPILVPPTPGRPLILYLTVQEASMGCMLGQQDETGKKEQAIYYLSKKFTEPETRYLLVEKTCCALAWASKKLRQYMLYYTTWLVSRMDPIKYIFEKPALTGKIARWQVLLSEFDILFVARKAIKGQAIADYLADYPSEQLELMDSEFPDEDVMTVDEDNHGRWKLYFDGAANAVGSGNWRGLGIAKGTTNSYRSHNHFADALATLASLIKLVEGDDVRPLRIETRDIPAYCVCVEECMNVEAEIDNKPWYYDIKRFIQDREYPPRATENEKKYIRRMAFQFFLSGEILYKRTHDATLLRCVDAEEANRLIQEMHAGLMGAHANGPFLARKIMRAGYYWLTMERDCIRHVQTCHKCQMYQNSKNAPPQYLHTMASPWPFSAWGMDWVEACSFKNVTQVAVTRFVKNNIICRYGMPEMLITDNASNLNNRMMDQLCQQFKIQHHNSAPYRPKMNGAVEAANKNVKKILSKMTETYKDWHEHLPYALCAYRTSVRTSVGATPYSLVYGMEAVLPVEVEIPSLRILSQTQLEEAEWAQARYEQLNFIDEKRLAALCHGQLYQRRIERAYNKKARPRTFQPGDLVLKKRNMALSDPRGKFAPSYEGPYVVKKAFSGGAIILADMDGEEFRSPINSDSVIKRPGKQRKSVRTLPSDGNYRGYGENLGRGAIGKSNVESWTWRLSVESPQSSGKGRIPLIMLLPDGASSGTQRIHHLVNLVKSSDHRETLLIEPRSIGLKSVMHQIQLSLQNLVVTWSASKTSFFNGD